MDSRLDNQPLCTVRRERRNDAPPIGSICGSANASFAWLYGLAIRNRRHDMDHRIAARTGNEALDRVSATENAVAAVQFLKNEVRKTRCCRNLTQHITSILRPKPVPDASPSELDPKLMIVVVIGNRDPFRRTYLRSMVQDIHEKLPVIRIFLAALEPCNIDAGAATILAESNRLAQLRLRQVVRIELERDKHQPRLIASGLESLRIKTEKSSRLHAFIAHCLRGLQRPDKILFTQITHGISLKCQAWRGLCRAM